MSETFDLLRIVHQTIYRYSDEVNFMPHRLVVRPREGHDMRVESLALATIPRSIIVWSRDVFGNSVAHAYFTEGGNELRIESDVIVRRVVHTVEAPPEAIAISHPLQYEEMELPAIAVYLQPVYPQDTETLQAWLRLQEFPSGATAEEMLLQLTEAIYKLLRYQRREEKGVQSPATTLTLGCGSCRDAACLLMESARLLGIATRFASGYLDCAATRGARGVTHAWTEAYFPGLGWRGYDPSNGKRCTQKHVVTGVSNHPRGVMPITGRFAGPAGVYLGMSVQVEFSVPKAFPEIAVPVDYAMAGSNAVENAN